MMAGSMLTTTTLCHLRQYYTGIGTNYVGWYRRQQAPKETSQAEKKGTDHKVPHKGPSPRSYQSVLELYL